MHALKTVVVTAVAVFAVTAVAMAGASHVLDGNGRAAADSSAVPAAGITLSDAQFARLMDALRARDQIRDRVRDRARDRVDDQHDGADVRHAGKTAEDAHDGQNTWTSQTDGSHDVSHVHAAADGGSGGGMMHDGHQGTGTDHHGESHH